jgi:eukaryotic-like serine/threonine-protein kinase
MAGSPLSHFSAVPADPDEARQFLERRLRLLLGFLFLIWLGLWVAGPVFNELLELRSRETWARAPSTWAHLAIALAVGALALYLRRGRPSLEVLQAIDVGAVLAQALAASLLLLDVEARSTRGMLVGATRPEVGVLLGVTQILVLRAALIPSKPARTAVVSALAMAILAAATGYIHATMVRRWSGAVPMAAPITVAVWGTVSVATSAVVSFVVYGLQARVREAMALGQYTLEEKLGEGGMGVVYLARHALLRRPTAVKLLAGGLTGAPAIARFEREVQLTSQLSHPNIVAVYDFGRTPDGIFYYAMEYVDGIDLERVVERDGPLPPGRVLDILEQVAGALAEAHAVGLIHRDIKPANLLIRARPRGPESIKVVDFGLVKDVSGSSPNLTGLSELAGTPLYMAPEAIASPDAVDARSDIYALGAVGYFLLTGQPLFEGATAVVVLGHHLHSSVTPPSERTDQTVPKKLEAVLLRCLSKRPDDRPGDAAALVAELGACDDVPPWTPDHAARWWADRAPSLRAAKPSARGPRTLAIDLGGRDRG